MKKTTKYTFFILAFLLLTSIFIFSKPVYADNRLIQEGMIFNIQNKNSGKYLNVNSATDANGTNVNQWSNDGSIEQKFRIVYYSNDDAYRIYAMCSDKGASRVVDVLKSNGNIYSGCNIDIWSTGDDPCQFFEIRSAASAQGVYFAILLKGTNLALTAYGTGNGSGAGTSSTSAGNVYISTYTNSSNQHWKLIEVAATPAYPYRMTKGIGNQTYFIDSSASAYTSYISNGSANWSPTINFSRAYDNSSSATDYYACGHDGFGNTLPLAADWLATTTWHIPSTSSYLAPARRGWSFAKITINNDSFIQNSNNTAQRNATISHEIGHAFGLKHYEVSNTIMRSGLASLSCFTPQSLDRIALNYKY